MRPFVMVAATAAAWHGWASSRTAAAEPLASTAAPQNGALVIPSIGDDGKPAEPRILVPITGPRLPPTLAAPAGPAATNSNEHGSFGALVSERVLGAQVALARRTISSGSIDGMLGPQTRAALRVFQEREAIPATGRLDADTESKLVLETPVMTNYIVAAEDLARPLPLGKSWLAKSEQPRLDYESLLELVAEKSRSHPKLVRWLNPSIDWSNVAPGTSLKVVHAEYPAPASKAAFVRIFLSARMLQVFDADTNLLAHFPCSIAARVEKRPVGETLRVSVTAPDPNYTFDPEVFPESEEAQQLGRKLILQPGPNNPVGTAWIGLDKPGYGIHGTPRPEEVGRTESHGCFRLANWNAEYLLKLVAVGMPVLVEP